MTDFPAVIDFDRDLALTLRTALRTAVGPGYHPDTLAEEYVQHAQGSAVPLMFPDTAGLFNQILSFVHTRLGDEVYEETC